MRDLKIKQGFVTLLSSENYIEAVLILNASLRAVQSKYPLIVACTPSIIKNERIIAALLAENCIVEPIAPLRFPKDLEDILQKDYPNLPNLLNTGAKLEVFSLKHYDKLVFLDADGFLVKNIDFLFNKKDGSSTIQKNEHNEISSNCSVFVFCPRNHNINFYRGLVFKMGHNDGAVFESMWFQVKDNEDYRINDDIYYLPFDENIHNEVYGYHLWKPHLKYWLLKDMPNTDLANLYKNFLIPIRTKYKFDFS